MSTMPGTVNSFAPSRSSTPSTPVYSDPSGNTTPAPASSSGSNSSKPSRPKPTNVFSNDGSFLERFQRSKKEEDEKEKQQEELLKKRKFDERFKNRGKRKAPEPETNDCTVDDSPSKKIKPEKELTEYEREVKSYSGSLKDNGIGVRPLVK